MAVKPRRHQEFPSLDPSVVQRIRRAVHAWAKVHPDPRVPVLLLMDGSEMTAGDIADALDHPETGRGRTLVRMFAVAMADKKLNLSMDEILKPFEQDISAWRDIQRPLLDLDI